MTASQTSLRPGGQAPAGGARPMPPDAAAWVRDHAWTEPMRREHKLSLRNHGECACDYSLTTWCRNHQHNRCGRAEPLTWYETLVCGPGGVMPVYFTDPYQHPTTTATGTHQEWVAMVWLADRVCAWQCPCPCHAPAAPVQLDLFAAVAS